MRRLYLVRHGQTELSARGAYSGHVDVALTDEGRRQAKGAAEKLADQRIELVVTSPLRRARESAEILGAAAGVPVRIDDRLIEVDYGPLEGLDRRAAEHRFGDAYRGWREQPFGRTVDGAEPLRSALARATAAARAAVAHAERVAIVAHQGVLRLVLIGLGCVERGSYFRTHIAEADPILLELPGERSTARLHAGGGARQIKRAGEPIGDGEASSAQA
jgi:broad specificity phosphatase PhoE